MIIQTWALLVDAYRELNAKKLFWITMLLNLGAVALFAALGISERGPTFLHWTFDNDLMNTRLVSKELFYKTQFVSWGIPVWLSWVATILALVSTAGLIPELISGGVIETVLSKPIGRVRLLLTKYLCGLLFVTAQVFVFSLGCFLVLGIRGGSFVPELFVAVPIVVLFFSYLFSVCVLIGLVTRSTIAALLLTVVFWFAVFIVNLGDEIVLAQAEGAAVKAEDAQKNLENQITLADRLLEQQAQSGVELADADGNPIEGLDARREAVNIALASSRARVTEREESAEQWQKWTDRVMLAKTILPKTQETIGLLSRYMLSMDDLKKMMAEDAGFDPEDMEDAPAFADPRVATRLEERKRGRTVFWVIGTSVAFEVLVLGLATVIFVRRDF